VGAAWGRLDLLRSVAPPPATSLANASARLNKHRTKSAAEADQAVADADGSRADRNSCNPSASRDGEGRRRWDYARRMSNPALVGAHPPRYLVAMVALKSELPEDLPRRPLKLEEYEQLIALGAFAGEHVELLFGEIVPMSPQSTVHSWLVNHLHNRLAVALAGRAAVRAHSPIRTAGASLPEPDVAVFALADDVPDRYPSDVRLVVEVADSSRKKDLGPKAQLHASSAIPVYWTIDLVQRAVRVHSEPSDGEYRVVMTYLPGQGAELVVPGAPDVQVAVDELFSRL
jgi:Uma2 family endonuclease